MTCPPSITFPTVVRTVAIFVSGLFMALSSSAKAVMHVEERTVTHKSIIAIILDVFWNLKVYFYMVLLLFKFIVFKLCIN